jgi:hypothetical protein
LTGREIVAIAGLLAIDPKPTIATSKTTRILLKSQFILDVPTMSFRSPYFAKMRVCDVLWRYGQGIDPMPLSILRFGSRRVSPWIIEFIAALLVYETSLGRFPSWRQPPRLPGSSIIFRSMTALYEACRCTFDAEGAFIRSWPWPLRVRPWEQT